MRIGILGGGDVSRALAHLSIALLARDVMKTTAAFLYDREEG